VYNGGGVNSGPGAARTFLLFHIISARHSKQFLLIRTFLNHGLRHLFGDHNPSSIFMCGVIYGLEGTNDANPQDANLTLVGEIYFP
jgi:hypothetical protein